MAKKKSTTLYVCSFCGEEYIQWQGRCNNCGNWNTLQEFTIAPDHAAEHGRRDSGGQEAVSLDKVTSAHTQRSSTGFAEFDRVLGGGIVPGSVLLLGGDPGIGKSTLLLQVVGKLAASKKQRILYVSGEESPEQIKLRAERVGVSQGTIHLLPATNVETIQSLVEKEPPALVIIDSIQTMYDPAFPSTPGSIVQVRESALRMQRLAKQTGVPIVLVGHITKEGTVAGPRTLEHMVDVVLYLEGEAQYQLRILRAVKNRFGDISETGIFAMASGGLEEVANPTDFLLAERVQAPGSVLSAIMEGSRPLLVEVQALVVPSVFGYPKRTSSGFDLNRLNLLLAVLHKRAGVDLSKHDVFLNVVGGLRIKDPAVDAAICLALASALIEKALPEKLCVLGEIGLSGELRAVSQQERRIKAVKDLGYSVPVEKRQLRELIKTYLS